MLTKPQSWEYIENRFVTDFGEENMIQLVQFIRASGLSDRLFGSTSMNKLVISVNNPIDYAKESIHIKFDDEQCLWSFNYIAAPNQYNSPEFSRIYSAEKGIEKFVNFIKMINW